MNMVTMSSDSILEMFSLLGGTFGAVIGIVLTLVSVILLLWTIGTWVITSLSIVKILKSMDLYEKYSFQAWIPYWQFVCIADILEDYDESIQSFGEIVRVLSVAKYVMLFVHIPFISTLLNVGYWLLGFYLIYRLSIILYGKVNIFHLVANLFGFSFIIYHIYAKKFEENKYEIMNKRNHVDISNTEMYNNNESVTKEVKILEPEIVKEENTIVEDKVMNEKPMESKEEIIDTQNEIDNVNSKEVSNEEFLEESFKGLGFNEDDKQ